MFLDTSERRAGELLAGMDNHGGDRKSRFHDVTLNLADLGIRKSSLGGQSLKLVDLGIRKSNSHDESLKLADLVSSCNLANFSISRTRVVQK